MHLSIKHSQAIEDTDMPVNPQQTPADILFLSFTDSDLSLLAVVADGVITDNKTLRLSSLAALTHPLSVDLYLEQVASSAKVILVRILGGYERWKYGADELAKLARSRGIKLIMVASCHSDERLFALSTVEKEEAQAVENCLAEGGVENARRVLQYLQNLSSPSPFAGEGGVGGVLPVPEIIENGKLYNFVIPAKAGIQSQDPHPRGDDNNIGNALIIFYRSHYLAGDVAPIDALLAAVAGRGMCARAFMVSSLKDEAALLALKADIAAHKPDIIIDATAFSAGSGAHPLAYCNAVILQVAFANMTIDDWRESKRGLSTSDMAMQVVLPEADGRVFTRAISFKNQGRYYPQLEFIRKFHQPELGRVGYVANLAAAWVNLRVKPNAEKKIALILSDYPQRAGRKGYAVGLDAMQSANEILGLLSSEGYLSCQPRLASSREGRLDTSVCWYDNNKYKARFAALPAENQAAMIAAWGVPLDDDFDFAVQQSGNVVVAFQPDRGSLADKKTGYHDAATPPNHHYLAFYWWLRDVLKIDAIIHLGTHGNLEWLPAKTAALSANCWPEIAVGALPVIYPYIVSDAGEAAQAKRRLSAVILSHLTPPMQPVALTPELAELESLTDEYGSADGLDGRRMKYLRDEIIFRAKKSGLALSAGDDASVMSALEAHLCDIKEQRVGDGLHVFGAGDNAECAANERRNLIQALAGEFIPPSAGGAPSRGRMDIFPTGRNLISVDPRTIPTKTASVIGQRAAADFVRRYTQDFGDYPKNVMMDLWGSATLRTGGDEIAQALALMGVNTQWDAATGRVSGFEILPDAEMGWPRVDVTIRISGLFRDVFSNLILLFDAAVQQIAVLQGKKPEFRIFGNAPSAYGAGAVELIDSGDWQTRGELGEAYINASHFAYGRRADGVLASYELRSRIKSADALIHVQDMREVDVLSGADFADSEGGFAAAASLLGADAAIYHMDTTNPEQIKTRSLAEEISLTLYARALNPKWIEGQMHHGYAGAAALADVVDNLFAFAASSDAVSSAQFDTVADAYLQDSKVREFMAVHNPDALQAIINRLNEACVRGLWRPRRNSVMAFLEKAA